VAAGFQSFPTFGALCDSLADRIVEELGKAVADRGRASLVVPGGTTPGAFFDVLANRNAPWNAVTVTLTDERWVRPDSDRSNERLVRSRLLVKRAESARLVPLKTGHPDARDAESTVDERVAAIARPFDVILAGMGDDGHTASWIPGADGLNDAIDASRSGLVRAIVPPRGGNLDDRITLTLHAFLQSRNIFVLVRGETKRLVYENARQGRDLAAMPIRTLIVQDRVPVDFFWTAN
jgi:6-phosphogluconolactonase